MAPRILFVCTGNICRSAYAQWRLTQLLDERGLAGAVSVASVGTAPMLGDPMHPYAVEVLRRVGAVADRHQGRLLTREVAVDAALILAMTRDHRSRIVRVCPKALRTTFTLLEMHRLWPAVDRAGWPTDPAGRLAALVDGLRRARGSSPQGDHDDLADPIGLPLSAFTQMQEAVDLALLVLAEALAPTPT